MVLHGNVVTLIVVAQDFTNLLRDYQDLIHDKKRFTGLIKDMMPNYPLQMNLLLLLYEIGIHHEILATPIITDAFAFRFVKQLVDTQGVSRLNADWAVSTWCVCFGKNTLGKPCEIKISKAKSGGKPVISDEQNSGKKQYQDLFRFKKSSTEKGYAITGFDGDNLRTLIFPNKYRNNSVSTIAERAFMERAVQEAVITDGITVIEKNAFNGCTDLKQVIFPDTLTTIGDAALEGCGKLITAMLPRRLERIGSYAFSSTGIRSVEFPDSVYWLGEGAYSHCVGITVIVIPEKVDHINNRLFEGCTSLKKVILPVSLISIGSRSFANCANLSFLSVPDSVKKIGENAFDGVNEKFILQCGAKSAAERYARANRIRFQLG